LSGLRYKLFSKRMTIMKATSLSEYNRNIRDANENENIVDHDFHVLAYGFVCTRLCEELAR
jgi:hypothetical protein